MEKLAEHTHGTHIYMRILLDGKVEEIDNYAGMDYSWNVYKTTGDNNPERREKIIQAFKALY